MDHPELDSAFVIRPHLLEYEIFYAWTLCADIPPPWPPSPKTFVLCSESARTICVWCSHSTRNTQGLGRHTAPRSIIPSTYARLGTAGPRESPYSIQFTGSEIQRSHKIHDAGISPTCAPSQIEMLLISLLGRCSPDTLDLGITLGTTRAWWPRVSVGTHVLQRRSTSSIVAGSNVHPTNVGCPETRICRTRPGCKQPNHEW